MFRVVEACECPKDLLDCAEVLSDVQHKCCRRVTDVVKSVIETKALTDSSKGVGENIRMQPSAELVGEDGVRAIPGRSSR
jgi:hypothetical protein